MKRLFWLLLVIPFLLPITGSAQFNGCSAGFCSPPQTGSGLSCSYTPVTTGTQSVAYTGSTPSASGGTPSYTFSETGSLPTGLSISSSTGVISGTPSVSGSFPGIQVKVTDSTSTVANCGSSFTLVISAGGGTVAFFNGAASTAFSGNTGTTYTVSFDSGSGTDRALVVAIIYLWSSTVGTVTVTYGGVSMTPITGATANNGGTFTVLYGLTGGTLPTGANNIVVTATQAFFLNVTSLAVTNANQTGGTTTFANGTGNTGSVTPSTLTVTSATNDMVFSQAGGFPTAFTGTLSPGVIVGTNQTTGLLSIAQRVAGSASVSTSFTMSTNGAWATAGVDIVHD